MVPPLLFKRFLTEMTGSVLCRDADALVTSAGTMLGLARNHAWNDPDHYCPSSIFSP